jgi:hypothetical protein
MRFGRCLSIALLVAAGATPLFAGDGDDDSFVIQANTSLEVELTSTLNSKTNQTGDLFTGKVTEPIISHGEEIVPETSIVEGHVTFMKPPGRVKGKAEMRLLLDAIKTPDGHRYLIGAGLQEAKTPDGETVKSEGTVEGPGKDMKRGAEEAGIAAAAGAGVGAIADGGQGALYGAAIGAVVGVVHMLAKHHGNVELPPGTDMTFLIPRQVTATTSGDAGPMIVPNAH